MGTDAAIMQVVNIIEVAEDTCLAPLGVPWEVAVYLVSLDKDDSTVIRSRQGCICKAKVQGLPAVQGRT